MTDKARFFRSFAPPLISFLLLTVLGIFANFGLNDYIKLTIIYVCVNAILAMSLNLVNGYTGQLSLGHAGFMAVGAYASAYLSTQWSLFEGPLYFVNFILYACFGGLLAAVAGFVVGLPSLRLRGDYLAIVTLGFGEIIRVILLNMDFVGGARGFIGIPGMRSISIGGFKISQFMMSYTLAIFWVLCCFFVIWRLVHSNQGRAFLSVREDEIAAEAMGIPVTRVKVKAFVISSFFAGIAGAVFAHYANYLNPSTFQFIKSVDAVIMVVLGGMGSMTGSIVAAGIITILPEALRPLQDITGVDVRMVIYAFTLILLMILRPRGLFGNSEITDLWRKYGRRSTRS